MDEKVPPSRLKGIAIYVENDLYDFARLMLRVGRAREVLEIGSNQTTRSYHTIYGLVGAFARAVDSLNSNTDRACTIVKEAGIDLKGLLVEEREAAEDEEWRVAFRGQIAKRPNHIFLVGVSRVGKTTIGAKLAKNLGVGFMEFDDILQAALGASISEIRERYPSENFRKDTAPILRRAIAEHGHESFVMVLSPSGALDYYWRILKKDENGTVVAILDDAESILNRHTPPDDGGNRVVARPTERIRNEYLSEIRKNISFFGKRSKKVHLRIHLYGGSADDGVEKIERALISRLRYTQIHARCREPRKGMP